MTTIKESWIGQALETREISSLDVTARTLAASGMCSGCGWATLKPMTRLVIGHYRGQGVEPHEPYRGPRSVSDHVNGLRLTAGEAAIDISELEAWLRSHEAYEAFLQRWMAMFRLDPSDVCTVCGPSS